MHMLGMGKRSNSRGKGRYIDGYRQSEGMEGSGKVVTMDANAHVVNKRRRVTEGKQVLGEMIVGDVERAGRDWEKYIYVGGWSVRGQLDWEGHENISGE